MEQSLSEGSQTFEQALYKLYRNGEVELDEALKSADSATNLSWLVNNAQPLTEHQNNKPDNKPDSAPDMSFDISLH
jgi:twitching motility protein PilU